MHWGVSLDLDRLCHGLRFKIWLICLPGRESLEELHASGLEVEGLRLHPWVVSDLLNLGS